MNYDRRYSPGEHPDYSRTMRSQQITPRGGIESRSQAYGREYPPLRSRSQTNVDQDYGDRFSQPAPFQDVRGLDTKSRSKSLDTREFRGGDDGYYRNDYPENGVVIPIRRDTGGYRNSPQNQSHNQRGREDYGFDDRRPEVHIPYNRDFGPRRSFDGRQGDSPKSYSSRYRDSRRAIEYGNEFDREDYGAVQPYRSGGAGGGAGGGGGYRSSSYHRSHHEASHGGAHELGTSRGAITQQPQVFHPGVRPVRPIQHHRVQCCCFKFVWPPWSYEQAPPPQPIYRNI